MQFVSFALVCVIAVQAVFVSAHPAAGKGERTVAQLHEEFNKAGDQLQADLKKAHARDDFKGDAHVQALLNAIEEVDKIMVRMVNGLTDPKQPLSESEASKLANEAKELVKKMKSELNLLKPEQRKDQLIEQILQNSGKRGLLLAQIAVKQGSDSSNQFSGLKESLTF